MNTRRRDFLALVLNSMGSYYRWAGKEPLTGVDCSGLVTWALWKCGGPDWRHTHDTDKLWNECRAPQVILPGDLCFYGGRKLPDGSRDAVDVSHVEVWVTDLGDSNGLTVGASGGDSTVLDRATAEAKGAKVRTSRTHLYRPDFRGWRSLPLEVC